MFLKAIYMPGKLNSSFTKEFHMLPLKTKKQQTKNNQTKNPSCKNHAKAGEEITYINSDLLVIIVCPSIFVYFGGR